MRVVLDTNILISACLKPGGLEARAIDKALSGGVSICISDEIETEYQEVFSRPKFAVCRGVSDKLLADVAGAAARMVPGQRISAASDDDDNRFLECAAAAAADYLITGNLRHFPPQWESTRIVNARRFLEITGCIIETGEAKIEA